MAEEEPYWNKWPAWLDESYTRPVCSKCATNMGWIILHYHDTKLNCFICENKKTNNRVTENIIRDTRLSKELLDRP